MGDWKRACRFPIVAVVPAILVSQSACMGPNERGNDDALSIIAALGLGSRTSQFEDVPNDSFNSPAPLNIEIGRNGTVDGSIDTTDDVDVYDIGPMSEGDRVVVEVAADFWLDAAAAVFDADQALLYLNDDRNYFAGFVDPYVNFAMRRDSDRCFVVVAPSSAGSSTGKYRLSVSVSAPTGTAAPSARRQTVLLNFDGAPNVTFGGRAPTEIAPFDASEISSSLSGQTDELIDLIAAGVREDYRALNVTFHTDADDVEPGSEVTTIHFGAYDAALLGVAANVDEFNEIGVQEAIVFTRTFEVFNALGPTIEEYAQALANVASHETGHLLGLVHTADVHGIMDITASLRQLIANQAFSRSPIERGTFIMGYQDEAMMLTESVGGDLAMVRALSKQQLEASRVTPFDPGIVMDSAVDRSMFSRCFCANCEAKRDKSRRGAH